MLPNTEIHSHFCSFLFSSIKLIRKLFLVAFSTFEIQSELVDESGVLADCFRFCSEMFVNIVSVGLVRSLVCLTWLSKLLHGL